MKWNEEVTGVKETEEDQEILAMQESVMLGSSAKFLLNPCGSVPGHAKPGTAVVQDRHRSDSLLIIRTEHSLH